MLPVFALLAETQATLALVDRTEVRARATEGDPNAEIDVLNRPGATLFIDERQWAYSLSYVPTFTLRDLELGLHPEILNTAGARAFWHDRRTTLTISEDGSYGYQNFTYLLPTLTVNAAPAGQPPQPVQLLPPPLSILYASSYTTIATTARATREWLLSASGTYQLSGGVNADSRATLPFQQGPRADAAAEYEFGRRDAEITSAYMYSATFTPGPCILTNDPVCEPVDQVAGGAEGWRHSFARTVDTTLSAGGTVVRERQHAYDAYRVRGYPTLDLSVVKHVAGATTSAEQAAGSVQREAHLHPGVLELLLDIRLAPVVDYRTGLVDQRAQATGTGSVTVERTTIHVTGGFAQSVPVTDDGAITFFQGAVEVAYRAGARIDVSGGIRGAWQSQPPFGAFFTEGAFAAVTYHEAAISF